ncbi:hypothetical protein U1701_14940 [Sphingomonas sp. PB2P19]|uniref:hypothetical protein n=1 Tax=Sphingomonas rhamnosi TaxID=3096156 RepID=UPI002FC737EF
MLARLILALLLAAFAFPASAPAACHDAPATHSMPMDHAPEQKATPPHGCIGCVPPSNWIAARSLDAPVRAPAMLIEAAAMLDIRGAIAPERRPPRLA